MGKKALKLICLQFFQFLTNFNEILSISVFFQGRLNRAIRSDLTLLQSAHFVLHSAHFALVFQLFCFSIQRAVIWCAGGNLDFINILIYCIFWQSGCAQCTFCTAQRALCNDFPTFLFFKLESCNLVCRREFRLREHSYTVFFGNQGAHGAHFALHGAHFAYVTAGIKNTKEARGKFSRINIFCDQICTPNSSSLA